MRKQLAVLTILLLAIGIVACTPQQVQVEVTRIITETIIQEVEVPIEITRIVEEVVEVTRIVERVVEVTSEGNVQGAVESTLTPEPPRVSPETTGSMSGIITVENAAGVKQLAIIEGPGTKPYGSSLDYSQDGSLLVVAYDNEIHVLDSAGYSDLSQFETPSFNPFVELSPVGDLLAIAYNSSHVRDVELRRLSDFSLIMALDDHFPVVRDMTFSPDGNTLVTVDSPPMIGGNAEIRFWNTRDAAVLIETDIEQPDYAPAVAFSPSGDIIAIGTSHGSVQTYAVDGTPIQNLGFVDYGVDRLAFLPDGITLAVASDDSSVRLWNVTDGTSRLLIPSGDWDMNSFAVSPDGTLLVTANSSTLHVWSVKDGSLLSTLEGHSGPIQDVEFQPDGRNIASTGADGTVRIWGLPAG